MSAALLTGIRWLPCRARGEPAAQVDSDEIRNIGRSATADGIAN